MKAKLDNVLKLNVSPFFFALCCAMLLCLSFTAKALADDVLATISGPAEFPIMLPDGKLVWAIE